MACPDFHELTSLGASGRQAGGPVCRGSVGGQRAHWQGQGKQRARSVPLQRAEPWPPLLHAAQEWANGRMRALKGEGDFAELARYLMTLPSTGQIAETIALYFGKVPEASAFSAEFLRRKSAEQAGRRAARGGGGGGGAGAPAAVVALSTGPSKWEKIPKKGGKKGKGKKVDAALLGFETGTNYAVLERPT